MIKGISRGSLDMYDIHGMYVHKRESQSESRQSPSIFVHRYKYLHTIHVYIVGIKHSATTFPIPMDALACWKHNYNHSPTTVLSTYIVSFRSSTWNAWSRELASALPLPYPTTYPILTNPASARKEPTTSFSYLLLGTPHRRDGYDTA